LYPGYLVDDRSNSEVGVNYKVTFDDNLEAFKWAENNGDRILAGSKSRIYFYGLSKDVVVDESYYSYLFSNYSRGNLIFLREGHKKALIMRSQPYQYALPSSFYNNFSQKQNLGKVYSNENNMYYWSRKSA
jgi:hypothetical protein